MAKLNKAQKALLAEITEATNGEPGYKFVSQLDAEYLLEAGLIEVNNEMQDGEGKVAARAVNTTNTTKAAPVSKFEIETGIEVPTKATRSGAGRSSVYPFEALEVGQSFFVANEGEKDAYKSMSSTVSSANARFTEEVEGETRVNRKGKTVPVTKQLRHFMHVRAEKDGVQGTRVFRVAVDGESDKA